MTRIQKMFVAVMVTGAARVHAGYLPQSDMTGSVDYRYRVGGLVLSVQQQNGLPSVLMTSGVSFGHTYSSGEGRNQFGKFPYLFGTFTDSVTVTLSSATLGAEIRYTTNGSDPTESSALYSTPLVLSIGTSFRDTLLSPVTMYGYTVEAVDTGANRSGESASVCDTIHGGAATALP